jgi:hypothetical protein
MSQPTDVPQFVPLVAYNGTGMTGGDSLNGDLNIFYNVSCLNRKGAYRIGA